MLVDARVPVRRRIHDHGDADLRRQHVADRVRLGAVRAARDAARRRAARADRTGRAAAASTPTNCGNRRRAAPAAGAQARPAASTAPRGVLRRPRRHADARPLQDDGRARTRSARRSSATNFAPLLDLDQHFMRSTRADRSDAGLHVLPARRHDPHRGAVQRDAGQGLAEPPQDLRLHAEGAGRGNRVRAPDRHEPGHLRASAARDRGRRRRADGVLPVGRKEKDFDHGIEMALARVLASPQFIYRIEERAGGRRAGPGLSHQRSRSGVAAVVLPVEHGARRGAAEGRAPGPAEGSRGARAAGAAHAEGSEAPRRWPTTSPASG